MGYPSRQPQRGQAGPHGAMETSRLILVPAAAKRVVGPISNASIRDKRGDPPGPRAAGCSDEDQMCICCLQAALVTRTGCPHLLARQNPAKEEDTALSTWGQHSYVSPLPVISDLPT